MDNDTKLADNPGDRREAKLTHMILHWQGYGTDDPDFGSWELLGLAEDEEQARLKAAKWEGKGCVGVRIFRIEEIPNVRS